MWRGMVRADGAAVQGIAEAVHPAHPEDAAVVAERLRLYAAGCLVLDEAAGVEAAGVLGYAVAHPWRLGRPPALNAMLGRLPADADTFHIHDLALLPAARGRGLGEAAVDRLVWQARQDGFRSVSLVAVGRSPAFWRRLGFVACERDDVRAALSSYGAVAYMTRALGDSLFGLGEGPVRPLS